MDRTKRVVTRIPMGEIWLEDGTPVSHRIKTLTAADITELLRSGPVRFVVADAGKPLRWIESSSCFEFWKLEVKHSVCDWTGKLPLDAYPRGFCFSASSWKASGVRIVLLEVHH